MAFKVQEYNPRAVACLRPSWQEQGLRRAEPILELACVVFGISVAMVALVDGERVFIRNCFGNTAMARPGALSAPRHDPAACAQQAPAA